MQFFRTTDRAEVTEAEAFDARGVLKPGFTMRSRVMLRDGADAELDKLADQREANVARYRERISDAWKNPPPLADDATARAAAISAITDKYEKYDARIAEAWRS